MGSSNNGVSNTGLDLGLGNSQYHKAGDQNHDHENKKKLIWLRYDHVLPSLTLGTSSSSSSEYDDDDDHHHHHHQTVDQAYQMTEILSSSSAHHHHHQDLHGRPANYTLSTVSSFSNSSTTVKRDRSDGGGGGEEFEVEAELERFSGSRVSTNDELDEDQASPRKKLRLTKQQSVLLEDSFKEHNTLNPKQKQDLARQLNLRPRQVEVWFQNRRARTKLKQTEADYELMKKCCETLTEENKRLRKELQDLKSLKVTAPFLVQIPSTSATLTICPSCERICGNGGHDGSSFLKIGAKPHHNSFSKPFITNSSAAW